MKRFLKFLKKKQIKLVVFDFDQTITCIHTGGEGLTMRDVLEVREKHLASAAVNLLQVLPVYGIHVAIASFAQDRPKSIKAAAEQKSSSSSLGGELMIRAVFEPWRDLQKIPIEAYLASNKQDHLKALRNRYNVTRKETMLIDDDPTNIDVAIQAGYWGLWVRERRGLNWDKSPTIQFGRHFFTL